jgi:hypothetical protein
MKRLSNKIIVGLLDWGLGHTTRCIPIIKYLKELNFEVYIAAAPHHKSLIINEIEGLIFLDELPLYNISYSKNGKLLLFNLVKIVGNILQTIKDEKNWLKKMHQKYQFDFVISDNRYGFYLNDIQSFIITHQLSPRTGINNFADNLVRSVHYRFLTKFLECWVPDFETKFNLSGKLGHPKKLPTNVKYIGPLSRLQPAFNSILKRNLIIILSGPEPQRTILENILINQLKNYSGNYLLVRGLPGSLDNSIPNCINHLSADNLVKEINSSEIVICRSGYSSVMDLIKLQKKAIFIPTPGQTEQEYLAKKLFEDNLFLFSKQHQFILGEMLEKAKQFPFKKLDLNFEHFKSTVKGVMSYEL